LAWKNKIFGVEIIVRTADRTVFACTHMHGGTEQRTTIDRRTVFACARACREERDSQTGWHSMTGVLKRSACWVDVPVTSATWPGTADVISNEIAGRPA
jgi:hypothetical protein